MAAFRTALACALLLGALVPLPGGAAQAGARPRILLVGIDGLDWRIALPLLRAGELPEIASLWKSGTAGTLATSLPSLSPVLWTTIATGKGMEKHGIQGFTHPDQPTVLYSSVDRKTKAFWNILTDAGRPTYTVGWWLTFPVEPVRGVMVAQSNTLEDWAARGVLKGSLSPRLREQVYPQEQQEKFLRIAADVDRELPGLLEALKRAAVADAAPPPRAVAEALEESRWALRADAIYQRAAMMLLSASPPADLTAVYFGLTDVVGHRFWKYGGPVDETRSVAAQTPEGKAQEPPGELAGFAGWSRLIPAAYRLVDQMIGTLRRTLPPDATVILVSDHGMGPEGHADAPKAFFLAAGAGIRVAGVQEPGRARVADLPTLGRIVDILPTTLALLGVPAGMDMDGEPLALVLTPDVLAARPQPVASYDTAEWREARAKLRRSEPDDRDAERLEQLRALGYIK